MLRSAGVSLAGAGDMAGDWRAGLSRNEKPWKALLLAAASSLGASKGLAMKGLLFPKEPKLS